VAIARVQKAIAASNAVAYASNVTAGNFLVCCISTAGDVTNVTDTLGHTWTKAVDRGNALWLLYSDIWYVANCSGGANTVTLSGGFANFEHIWVGEYSGMATTTPLDQTASAQNDINEPDSTATATTAQADELLIGMVGNESTRTMIWNGNLTEIDELASNSRALSVGESIVSATGAYSSTATKSGTCAWMALIATFKGAAAAASNIPYDLAHSPRHQSIMAM